MKVSGVLMLAFAAVTLVAGCATGPTSYAGDATAASPATLQNQVPDCRNSGWYNRAANLCVSNGP